jgi:hypothetical protein
MSVLSGDFNAKTNRDDAFKLIAGNETFLVINNNDGV